MSDYLQPQDLIDDKKHSTFFAEVITGKAGGVAGGATIDTATNAVTSQVQKTMPKIMVDAESAFDVQLSSQQSEFDAQLAAQELEHDNQIAAHEVEHDNQIAAHEAEFAAQLQAQGWNPVSGSFEAGGTIINRRDILWWEAAKAWYSWQGTIPLGGYVVPAGSTPATAGGVSSTAWVDRTDGALRSDIGIVTKTFSSVSEMKASIRDGDEGKIVKWLSYYGGWAATTIGANGGNIGIVVAAGTGVADDGSLFDTASGLQVKAIFDNKAITFAHFGADYTKTTDSTSSINKAFAFAKLSKIPVVETISGSFLVSGQIVCEAPVNYYGLPSEGELGTGTEFYWIGNDDTVDVFYAKPSTNYKLNMRDVHNVSVHAETTTPAGTAAALIDRKCRSLIRYDGGHISVKNLRATSFNSADNFAGAPPALIGIWGYKAYSYNMGGHNYAHGCAIGFLNNDIDITSANIDNLYVQNNIACFVAYAPNGMNVGALSAEGSNVRWRVVAGNHSGSLFMTGLTIGGMYGFGNAANIQKGVYVKADITACLADVDAQVSGRLSAALLAAGSSITFTPSTSVPVGFKASGIIQGDVDIEERSGCAPDLFITSGYSLLNKPTLNALLSYSANGTITPKFIGVTADHKVKAAGADYGYLEKRVSLSAAVGETVIGTFSLSATNSKQVEIFGELLIQGSGDPVSLPKRFTAAITTPAGVVTVSLVGETLSDVKIRAQGGADVISSAGNSAVGATGTVYEVYIPNISRSVAGKVVGFKPTTSATCTITGSVVS